MAAILEYFMIFLEQICTLLFIANKFNTICNSNYIERPVIREFCVFHEKRRPFWILSAISEFYVIYLIA